MTDKEALSNLPNMFFTHKTCWKNWRGVGQIKHTSIYSSSLLLKVGSQIYSHCHSRDCGNGTAVEETHLRRVNLTCIVYLKVTFLWSTAVVKWARVTFLYRTAQCRLWLAGQWENGLLARTARYLYLRVSNFSPRPPTNVSIQFFLKRNSLSWASKRGPEQLLSFLHWDWFRRFTVSVNQSKMLRFQNSYVF